MACEVPWMRVREVWVHGVDLGAGGSFADIDSDVAHVLFDEAVDRLADRKGCPSVTFVVEESPAERRVLGLETPGRPVATGSAWAPAGWVLGRSDGTGSTAPGPFRSFRPGSEPARARCPSGPRSLPWPLAPVSAGAATARR
jgi:maleylpyruvate isomerase